MMPDYPLTGMQFVNAKLAVNRVGIQQEIVAQTPTITPEEIRAALTLKGGLSLRSGSSRVVAFVGAYAVGVHYENRLDETGRAYMPGHFLVVKQADVAPMKHFLALWLQDEAYMPPPATYRTISTLDAYQVTIQDRWSDNVDHLSALLARVRDVHLMGNADLLKQVINVILHGEHPIAFYGQFTADAIADICLGVSWLLPHNHRKKVSFTTRSTAGCDIATPANTLNIRFLSESDNAYDRSAVVFMETGRVTKQADNHPDLEAVGELLALNHDELAHRLLGLAVLKTQKPPETEETPTAKPVQTGVKVLGNAETPSVKSEIPTVVPDVEETPTVVPVMASLHQLADMADIRAHLNRQTLEIQPNWGHLIARLVQIEEQADVSEAEKRQLASDLVGYMATKRGVRKRQCWHVFEQIHHLKGSYAVVMRAYLRVLEQAFRDEHEYVRVVNDIHIRKIITARNPQLTGDKKGFWEQLKRTFDPPAR